jgi:diaminopimelate decarboxylase/aspartate kinase
MKDLEEVNRLLLEFKEQHWKGLNIWIEPGRYLVALSGVLLTSVTQLKSKEGVNYIGINTGFNSLIRPVLYGAYHVCQSSSQPLTCSDRR